MKTNRGISLALAAFAGILGLCTVAEAASTFTVINSGFTAYVIDGSDNPTLNLVRGSNYTFNVQTTGHPFWIKSVRGTGTGNAYNDGVTGNGTPSGILTFLVPLNASTQLFYNCQFHASMTGDIRISDPPAPPGIPSQATLNSASDTFLVSSAPDNNAGTDTGVAAGRDGNAGIRRGLIRFDLSGIPAGSTVTSAWLRLTVTKVPPTPVASTFDILRLLAAWGEGSKASGSGNNGAAATSGEASWNSRLHATTAWTVAGALADAAGAPSASSAVNALGDYTWSGSSLVADVQAWVSNPTTNFGWILRSQDETTPRTVRDFGSRESGNPPILSIGYLAPAVSNTAPTVSVFNPTNGAVFLAPASVLIEASATDNVSVASVAFFDGASLLGTDNSGPAYSVNANLFPGGHLLTAVATDNEGLMSTSAAVSITVASTIITNPFAERIPKGSLGVEVKTIADGMASPLGMGVPDDGSGRMFVYDQDGRVWVVTEAGGRWAAPLLDIRARLVTLGAYDERGLLGFAVHPDFANNPRVYTYSSEPLSGTADFANGLGTTNNHHSVIAEWQISAGDSNLVDTATRREIMRIDQPQSNHNGGAMHFGPDGLLYIVFGDGGSANDVALGHVPGGNGQATNNIWGSIIRIDVDGNTSANGQYGIPASNPFTGTGGLDEIYAYGLRNPFAFSFDSAGGALYLADVGQGKVEEVNVVTSGGNYGWNIKEGTFWFDGAGNIVTAPVRPVPPGLIDPIAQYDHDDGQAVIGGYVYRGAAISGLAGRYVFGDWGSFGIPSGRIYYLDATNGVNEMRLGREDRPLGLWTKGWGQDAAGEMYLFGSKMLGPSGATGRMLKLVPLPDPLAMAQVATAASGTLDIGWSGGAGPVSVQRKNALREAYWMDAAVTNAAVYQASMERREGFFRTLDVGHTPPILFSAYLASDFEVPSAASPAGGLGLFSLDGNTLTFCLSYAGLSGSATASHIHGPAAPGVNGPVLVNLQAFNGGSFGSAGTLSGVLVLTDTQKAHVLSGNTYVNLHTPSFPGGEIRGQLVPVLMQAELNGANGIPPVPGTGGGGLATMALVGNVLSMNLTYGGLSGPATAAHIHGPAGMGANAGVLADLAGLVDGAFGAAGSLSGKLVLNPAQLGAVYSGLAYINIHTGANPGGEIRGQILRKPSAVPLTASLSGLAERPTPVTTSATGSATLVLEGDVLSFNIQYEGLSGAATAAHLHGPAAASGSAGVLIDLAPFSGSGFGASGTLSGSAVVSSAVRNHLLAAQTYLNIHTSANPGGEIRGQVASVAMMCHLSGANERPAAVVTPGSGLGVLALAGSTLDLVVAYRGLTTNATAAHIHGPASLFGTAGVLVDLGTLHVGTLGTAGVYRGAATLTPDQLGHVIDGQTYINVHTSLNPAGEIRGQIQR